MLSGGREGVQPIVIAFLFSRWNMRLPSPSPKRASGGQGADALAGHSCAECRHEVLRPPTRRGQSERRPRRKSGGHYQGRPRACSTALERMVPSRRPQNSPVSDATSRTAHERRMVDLVQRVGDTLPTSGTFRRQRRSCAGTSRSRIRRCRSSARCASTHSWSCALCCRMDPRA